MKQYHGRITSIGYYGVDWLLVGWAFCTFMAFMFGAVAIYFFMKAFGA